MGVKSRGVWLRRAARCLRYRADEARFEGLNFGKLLPSRLYRGRFKARLFDLALAVLERRMAKSS